MCPEKNSPLSTLSFPLQLKDAPQLWANAKCFPAKPQKSFCRVNYREHLGKPHFSLTPFPSPPRFVVVKDNTIGEARKKENDLMTFRVIKDFRMGENLCRENNRFFLFLPAAASNYPENPKGCMEKDAPKKTSWVHFPNFETNLHERRKPEKLVFRWKKNFCFFPGAKSAPNQELLCGFGTSSRLKGLSHWAKTTRSRSQSLFGAALNGGGRHCYRFITVSAAAAFLPSTQSHETKTVEGIDVF